MTQSHYSKGSKKNVILPFNRFPMKVFLNDRIIEFVYSRPENTLTTDLVSEFDSEEKLKTAWGDFERYDKFRNLFVILHQAHVLIAYINTLCVLFLPATLTLLTLSPTILH